MLHNIIESLSSEPLKQQFEFKLQRNAGYDAGSLNSYYVRNMNGNPVALVQREWSNNDVRDN